MPRLVDRSGGFWIEVIRKRKPVALVVKQNLLPDQRAMVMLGEEAVQSVRGGKKSRLDVSLRGGRLHYNRFSSGTYPYGIAKKASPDGTPYEPLSPGTLKHRKWKQKEGIISTARGAAYILRETSKKIFEGIAVSSISSSSRGVSSTVIRFANPRLAEKQDRGGAVRSPWFGKVKESKIPARPFIGFQQAFVRNFLNMMKGGA